MKVPVINIKGKTTGREVELSNKVFGIEPNDHAVYLDVKQFLANQRQGNAKTKERAEIKGSTRKIKKQKGKKLIFFGAAYSSRAWSTTRAYLR